MEKHCSSNAVHGSARSAQTLSPHEVDRQLAWLADYLLGDDSFPLMRPDYNNDAIV
jgi:hypothetical protein